VSVTSCWYEHPRVRQLALKGNSEEGKYTPYGDYNEAEVESR
jgi:hypothetical protein